MTMNARPTSPTSDDIADGGLRPTTAGGLDGAVDRADTLAEQAYAHIRDALMNGLLAPGESVSVRRIANTFGISLTPAREALVHLTAERALVADPRRTFTVPALTRAQYRELLTIRLLLEGHATEAAVANLTPAGIDALTAVNDRFSEAIASGAAKPSLELNRQFHFTIYKAAAMPALFGIIEGLWLRVGPAMNLLHPEYQRGRRGLNNHVEAIAAIRDGDGPRARAVIERDLIQGADHILPLLGD